MSRRTRSWIAASTFVALVLLHLDFWRPQRSVLWFGWLPEDLAYRLIYCLLAWLYILLIGSWFRGREPNP